jgi:Protein of unknown function (DUF664)
MPTAVSRTVSTVVHKPGRELDDPKELLLGFLDYYRSVIIRKIDGLTDAELRASRPPSGWTPLELLKHLENRTAGRRGGSAPVLR